MGGNHITTEMESGEENSLEFMIKSRLHQIIRRINEHRDEAEIYCKEGSDYREMIQKAQICASKLENMINRFTMELNEYFRISTNPSPDEISRMSDAQLNGEEILAELKCRLSDKLDRKNNENQSVNEQAHVLSAKLPTLTLPEFSGDVLTWYGFWDVYKSNIHDRPIADVDKLLYLKSTLKGQPRNIVDGLEITNNNYAIAIQMLTNRYGKPSQIIDAHYSALSRVKAAGTSIAECRTTLNNLERHLRVLQSLGEDTEHNHLRFLIKEKFPGNIIYEMKMKMKEETIGEMRKQLELIITAREEVCEFRQGNNSNGEDNCTAVSLHSTHKERERTLENRPVRKYNTYFRRDNYTEIRHINREEKNDDRKIGYSQKRKRTNEQSRDKNEEIVGRRDSEDHNRALCYKKVKAKTGTTLTTVANNGFTVLQTAIAKVKNEKDHNRFVICRLLLDSGSQRSYVTEEIVKNLDLSVVEENRLSIFGFACDTPRECNSRRVKLEIKTMKDKTVILHANEVPAITKGVATPNVDLGKRKNKPLTDDGSLGGRVDILVGNDYYFDFISTDKIRLGDNLFLVDSVFGWIVSGKINAVENENILSVITYCQNHDPNCVYFTEPDLPLKNMDISFLWALESIGITDNPKATREEEAIKHLNDTIQYVDGRYMVKWPWIQYPPQMPTNFGLAYGRLKGLLQRLNEDSLGEYKNILNEQLQKGIIEIIDPVDDVYIQKIPPIHYLPHHVVKQEGKKGRIVYDASGKLRDNKSLNECMYKGPSMIGDLVALLIHFRTNKVAVVADVEKAFLQVGLQSEDRDVTRFVWVKDETKPLSMDNLIHMRFCRVPFGIIASPFILTATIKYHVTQNAPDLISKIVDKFYVDNFVTGTDSTKEAIQLYESTRRIFDEMAMNIRDWTSNDEAFLDAIPSEYKDKRVEEIKILGLIWNIKKDTLRLNIKSEPFSEENVKAPQSKRNILSMIASMYDPCGLCAPLILPSKLLLQQLWDIKIKWDTVLPADLQKRWEDIIHRLEAIKNIEIPRYMGSTGKSERTVYELHAFSDASKQAYATVIYLVAKNEGRRNVALVMAKSKVVPKEEKEKLRMPRLELLGCYLGSKLLTYIKKAMDITIEKDYLWTDSQIVVSWTYSNKLLPPFVGRRIDAIKENKQLELRYIDTDSNPADVATRPDLWEKKKSLWFNGPEFLRQGKEEWPKHSIFGFAEPSSGQGPSDTLNLMEVDEPAPDETLREGTITVDNNKIIKDLQKEYFRLKSEGKRTSLAINLDLFKDIDGVLRCNGRMKNAVWSFDKRHPILIPRDCNFTTDLVMKIHRDNYHMKANHTLSKVRELYWIPKGKSAVQRILMKCPECIKHGGGPFKLPPAPALPHERVNYSAPFTYTGVDYMGPVFINNGDGNKKRWICLFTCLAVRAIHLEVVEDLSAEEGLLALRRMISTRGVPSIVTSDNALHFKLIAETVANQYCVDKQILWRFITPLSPWAGGFYERLIGIVKNCLKKTLGKHMLRGNQLSTIIKEIEAVVNSRPLTSVDSETDFILRPADFLTVGKVITLEGSTSDTDPQSISVTKTSLIEGWKRALAILKEFKDMFSNRYLLSLRERYGHLPRQPRIISKLTPTPGQIVQIKGDSNNRNDWKVGKITSLIPSADGLCRVAKVLVGKTEYTRSIAHLYPLEIEDAHDPIMDINGKGGHPVEILDANDDMGNTKDVSRTSLQVPASTTGDIADNREAVPLETAEVHVGISVKDKEVPSTSTEDKSLPDTTEADNTGVKQRLRRVAATRAMEKIKEWTSELTALILHSGAWPSGSVATSASY